MQWAKTSLGNSFEWFDFALFLYLAPVLGALFFPTKALQAATLTAFAVFTIGYLCRPLGGILFGFIGDTQGRSIALKTSILMMSVATLCIGLLPTYSTIGMAAPIIFIMLRMIQGISAGGEYSGIVIYLAESAPAHQRGVMTSLAGSGSTLGFLLATISILLLQQYFSSAELMQYAWRIPFVTLGFLGTIIFYLRLNLPETPSFEYLQAQRVIKRQPLWVALRYAPKSLLKVLGLTCFSSIFYIILFGVMPTYLAKFSQLSLPRSLSLQSLLLFAMLFLIPLGGWMGDQFGRRNLLLCTTTIALCLVLPGFYLLQSPNPWLILCALGCATLISSFDQGNNLAAFVENCPAAVRYSGIGFAFNLGNAVFGGTAPLVVSLLIIEYGKFAPAYYIMGAALVSLLTVTTLLAQPAKLEET